jgi:hypothetical protein
MPLPVALRRTNSQTQIVRRSFSTEQRLASRWPIRLRKIVRPPPQRRRPRPHRSGMSYQRTCATPSKQLNDGELDELLEATFDEAMRRGRLPLSVGTDSTPSFRRPSDLVTKRSPPTHKRGQADIDEVPLTRSQLNAVRAAFKGWYHAITDCPTVRNFSSQCAEGVGIGRTKTVKSRREPCRLISLRRRRSNGPNFQMKNRPARDGSQATATESGRARWRFSARVSVHRPISYSIATRTRAIDLTPTSPGPTIATGHGYFPS